MIDGYEHIDELFIIEYLKGIGKLIEFSKDYREIIEKKRDVDLLEFINTVQFFAVNAMDMLITIKSIQATDINLERNLFARLLSIINYQIIRQQRDITGKRFRNSLKNICNNNTKAIENLNKIGKQISEYDNNNSEYFKEIRNSSLAHRKDDSKAQIDFIENLEIKRVFGLSLELVRLIDLFYQFLVNFMKTFDLEIRARLA